MKPSMVPDWMFKIDPDGKVSFFGHELEDVDGSEVFDQVALHPKEPFGVRYALAFDDYTATPGYGWGTSPIFGSHTKLQLYPTRSGGRCLINNQIVSPEVWWRAYSFQVLNPLGFAGRTRSQQPIQDYALAPLNGGGGYIF